MFRTVIDKCTDTFRSVTRINLRSTWTTLGTRVCGQDWIPMVLATASFNMDSMQTRDALFFTISWMASQISWLHPRPIFSETAYEWSGTAARDTCSVPYWMLKINWWTLHAHFTEYQHVYWGWGLLLICHVQQYNVNRSVCWLVTVF